MRMDVYTLRRFNLRKLKQRFKTWSALAERMDIDASYLSCIAGPNPTRKIGDELAAKIEQAAGLADGQLSSLSLALDLPDQDLESALLAADAGALQLVLTIGHADREVHAIAAAGVDHIEATDIRRNSTRTGNGHQGFASKRRTKTTGMMWISKYCPPTISARFSMK